MGTSASKATWNNKYGFNAKTTATTVATTLEKEGLDVSGRTYLITGTTNGIGKETLLALARMQNPPHIIVANRNPQASEQLIEEVKALNPNMSVEAVTLDLSSFQSVRECAQNVLQRDGPLHGLLLNAGVFIDSYGETKEGYERNVGINHLGHFYLTKLLLPKVIETAQNDEAGKKGRIVVVASHSHYLGSINFNDFPLSAATVGNAVNQRAYAQSKLCNVLFSNELSRRLQEKNAPVTVNSLHPASMTGSNIGESNFVRFAMRLASFFTRSLEQAASTSTMCLLSPEVEDISGRYFDECHCLEASEEARDPEKMSRLWEYSEQQVEKFEQKDAAPPAEE